MLDGKEITDTARQFLRNWHATRESNKKKRDEFVRQGSFLTETGGSEHLLLHEWPLITYRSRLGKEG